MYQCSVQPKHCSAEVSGRVTHRGKVEGSEVTDILLDTGCSRTMVKHSLVPEERSLEGQAVTIQCAHSDVALYPLAGAGDRRSKSPGAGSNLRQPASISSSWN